MTEGRWFEQAENKVKAFQMLDPYSLFWIGSYAEDGFRLEVASKFDIFVNVSPIPGYSLETERPRPDTIYHWYPLREAGFWNYEPFFWSKKILDEAFDENKSVYLHCESGVNRSHCIGMAWLTSREHTLEEAALIIASGNEKLAEFNIKNFQLNVDQGCIPNRLPELYDRMEEFGNNLDAILSADPALIPHPKRKKT